VTDSPSGGQNEDYGHWIEVASVDRVSMCGGKREAEWPDVRLCSSLVDSARNSNTNKYT